MASMANNPPYYYNFSINTTASDEDTWYYSPTFVSNPVTFEYKPFDFDGDKWWEEYKNPKQKFDGLVTLHEIQK